MVLWDDRILEIARVEDSVTATELSKSEYVRVTRQHISRRLSKLAEHGLLMELKNGVYVLTERGEKYLDGEIDTSLDVPDVPPGVEDDDEPAGATEPGGAG